MTKIARTPPSSSTGGRTRGPGLPVSKDAVNTSWQIFSFSYSTYRGGFFQIPKCERKSSPSTVNHAALLVAVSSLVFPTQEYRPSSFALNSLAWEQSQPRTMLSPAHLGLPPVSLHQGASEYPRKDSTLDRWRRRIARRLLRLA